MQTLKPLHRGRLETTFRILLGMLFVAALSGTMIGLGIVLEKLLSLGIFTLCLMAGLLLPVFAGLSRALSLLSPHILQIQMHKLGEPIARAESPVSPGAAFRFEYNQPVNNAVTVKAIEVKVVLRESVRYMRDGSTISGRHDHLVLAEAQPGRQLRQGDLLTGTFQLLLPDQAMHTWRNIPTEQEDGEEKTDRTENQQKGQPSVQSRLKSRRPLNVDPALQGRNISCTLSWVIKVRVRLKNWVDYLQEYEVMVQPNKEAM